MKKSLLPLGFLLLFTTAQAADPIPFPRLLQNGGKAAACLESAMRTHFNPGESIVEWRGPGVRGDSTGAVDPTTSLYVFRLAPTDRWFGIAFYSTDDLGWRIFTYTGDSGKLQIGYRAKSMESIAYLFGVKPHDGFSARDGEEEIDVSGCAEFLSSP